MNKFEIFIDKHFRKIALFLLVVILFNTCGNPVKPLNKRVDKLILKLIHLLIFLFEDKYKSPLLL